MASHFSTIGMPTDSMESFHELVLEAIKDVDEWPCSEGRYLRWASVGGGEIWVQVNPQNEINGASPHFAGQSKFPVRLTARVGADGMDGGFYGWASPGAEGTDEGCYPFVFDAPDFCLHNALTLPATVEVQIAAFAHDVTLYPSREAYSKTQEDLEVRYSDRSFIPTGLFAEAGTDNDPKALAMLTGHILNADRLQNELTGGYFHWLLVETFGGVYDVVLDEEFVSELPVIGGIVSGEFWLSGKILGLVDRSMSAD